jgi:FlaA1/EpsC-like NDP-sugar epimerase
MLKLYRNLYLIAFSDLILFSLSLIGAFKIRYDYGLSENIINYIYWILPVSILIKFIVFYFLDLYKGMWRYTSTKDLVNILKASTASAFILIVAVVLKTRFAGISRSVFFIDWCLTVLFISGSRLSIRFYFNFFGEKSLWNILPQFFSYGKNKKRKFIRTLIIGAGDCGEKIYREIRDNSNLDYKVIGFLDDSPLKQGRKIHGVSVLGTVEDVKKYVDIAEVEEIIITIPSATSSQIRRIVDFCNWKNSAQKT